MKAGMVIASYYEEIFYRINEAGQVSSERFPFACPGTRFILLSIDPGSEETGWANGIIAFRGLCLMPSGEIGCNWFHVKDWYEVK